MLLPGHLLVSYFFVDHVSRKIKKRKLFIITTLIFSILPDIDILFVGGIARHHQTLTHAPLFWILVFILFNLLALALNSAFIKTISFGILIGAISHMILDTFGMSIGLSWLAPFSWKDYSFLPLNFEYAGNNWWQHYVRSTAFIIEALVTTTIIVKRLSEGY